MIMEIDDGAAASAPKVKQPKLPAKTIDGAFLRALQEHRQGEILTELSIEMRKAVESAQRIGRAAKLLLVVTLTPNGNAIAFTAEVDTKLPKEPPFAGIFFTDDAGNLFRNDPGQQDLPALKSLSGQGETQEPLKEVAS